MGDLSGTMLKAVIPILRIFDETAAKAFYLDFLGFKTDWEHRFEEDLPLYTQISLGSVTIHLSGHHGDGSPGAALRLEANGLDEWCAALNHKKYKYARPGIGSTPWGMKEMEITDPFGNKLIFFEQNAGGDLHEDQ